jgi:uncharacterized membrane protein YhaH (DUF805 family)
MNRARYWNAILSVLGLSIVLSLIAGITHVAIQRHVPATVLTFISGAMFLALAAPLFFIAIKRLHDRNKSGHWLWLLYLAPGALNMLGQLAVAQGASPVGRAVMLAGICISIWPSWRSVSCGAPPGPTVSGPIPCRRKPPERHVVSRRGSRLARLPRVVSSPISSRHPTR